MVLYGSNKRSHGRAKREFTVQIKVANVVKQVYTIDFSTEGVKVGGPTLTLILGEQIELIIEQSKNKFSFFGQVTRQDGLERINRIGREGNVFFIKITDEKFVEFVKSNFNV
jgi:PilZ domain